MLRLQLTSPEQQRALEIVGAIAHDLQARYAACVPADQVDTLVDGRVGAVLLHAYLSAALDDEGAQETAVRLLTDALTAHGPQSISLCDGFIGVAWTLAHLADRFLESGAEDPNDAVDQVLLGLLSTAPWPAAFDLYSGLVGIGVYALERLPRPAARACLAAVVDRLAELAEPRDDGVTWWTTPDVLPEVGRQEYPRGYANLGVAHGVPGVIAFLAKACAAGVAEATARPLLDGAVTWLLAQRLPPDASACFPSVVLPEGASPPARTAWCYGDPGVATTLLLAARAVGEPAWETDALAIAHRAAARPVDESRVIDASLCHGAAGLAHMFTRLSQATDEPAFADAARQWLGRALAYRRPGEGIGGFGSMHPDPSGEPVWRPDPGFLSGAAGTGLALLATATPVEPAWDRVLLLT